MADDPFDKLGRQLPRKDPGNPPLHLWHPELSGDIDILIQRDGSWIHEGSPIRRPSLVRLFASILRREADGEYYLVTPVEKWRVQVEGLPLQVVDFDIEDAGTDRQILHIVTNTGRRVSLGKDYPLFFPEAGDGAEEGIPAVALEHGLAAQFNRAAWYRLVEASRERNGYSGILSDGLFFSIAPEEQV